MLYGGIDCHKRYSQVRVINEHGQTPASARWRKAQLSFPSYSPRSRTCLRLPRYILMIII
jgi:hypothetical protein